ncbi:MAG: hypothetical protein LC790_00290, partial [Actinobacteria bacterium]|nr:hypothetical protein [Actinomycetota bacterium]
MGCIADLIDIAALEPDGLIVTRDGRYVRVIDCEFVPNPITADPTEIASIEAGWASLFAAIPDHQGLSLYAQTDPIPIDDAMSEDDDRVARAIADDLAADPPREDLARTRRRFLQAQRQSVTTAASGEQPAVQARYWVAVPWRPEIAITERFKTACSPPRPGHRTSWQAHQRAARDSLHYTEQIAGLLTGLGIDPHITGPVETLAVLWERLHPAARTLPDLHALGDVARVVQATDPDQAAAHRQQIVDAIASGPEPVGISATDRRWLQHADGTLEETMHLGTVPQETSPWWLAHLLQVPMPCTVAVHISVGDRSRTRSSQRRRWARLRAAHSYKQRRGQLVGSDEEDALDEAQQLDRELRSTVAATVYEVATYVSFRQLDGDQEAFGERLKSTARAFSSLTDARVLRGAFLNVQAYPCTLPIAADALRATRAYAQRNIAHCSPLVTAACGCPEGLILGFADPGGTLERLDPYDPRFQTYLTFITGQGGGGKTVMVNALLLRAIAQGMRGFIIDRSTISTGDGQERVQGHYDPLLSLVPGSAKVHVGSGGTDVISPWDVPNPAAVAGAKFEFLLAFHALLIGNLSDCERRLTADEEGPLTTAIAAVYARCATSGERPRETLLVDELRALADRASGHGNVAATIHSLIARLEPYVQGGPLAHIADWPTTIAPDRPLTLFDIAGAPPRLIGALILTIVDHIEHAIHQTRSQFVRGELADTGAWAGQPFLVIEEGWSLTASDASGAWINEYARRSRHWRLWLIWVTQFIKDSDNEQGRALMENSSIRLLFKNNKRDLEYGRDPLGLTDTDIAAITDLQTRPGLFSTVYLQSPRGRGQVRSILGSLE